MSAAAEYYGWLLSQGYGASQLEQFADYAKRADRGEISHNKAYRMACGAGYQGVDGQDEDGQPTGDRDRSFGTWMDTAHRAGWIDKGLDIIGSVLGRRQTPPASIPPPPPRKKDNTALIVVGGIAVIGLIGLTIYLTKKK